MDANMRADRATAGENIGQATGLVLRILNENKAILTAVELRIGDAAIAALEALRGQIAMDGND